MLLKMKEWRYWEVFPLQVDGGFIEMVRPQSKPTLTGSYLAGYVAQRRNKVDAAAKYYSRAFDAGNSDANLIVFQSAYKSLLLAGELNEAVKKAYGFYEKDKESLSAMMIVVNDLIKKEKFAEASQILSDGLTEGENSNLTSIDILILPYISAWVQVGEGQMKQALDALEEKVGKYKVFYLFTNYQRGLMWELQGDDNLAYDAYKQAMGKMSLPYHLAFHAGNLMERLGKWDEAKELYQTYDAQHPQSGFFDIAYKRIESQTKPEPLIKSVGYGVAEVLLEATRMLIRSGYPIEGLAYAQLALHLDAKHEEANLLVAQSLELLESFDGANKFYGRIDKNSGLYDKAAIAIARNYYHMDEKQKALDTLEALLKKNDQSTLVLLTIADLYRQDKAFAKATQYYEKALKILEANEEVSWRNYFAAGIAYERAGDWEKGEKYLQEALKLEPERPEILNYLGYSWIDRKVKMEEGKQMIAAALMSANGDPHILDSMGWAYYLTGDYEKAVLYLENAVEEKPYDTVLNEHLGDIYWKLGRRNEAEFQWMRALNYPDGAPESDPEVLKKKLKYGLQEE